METFRIKEFILAQYRLEELAFKKETKGNKDTKKWSSKAHWLRGRLELIQVILINCFSYSKESLLEETLKNWQI